MSGNAKYRVQLNVEALEGRQLASASPVPVLPTSPHFASTGQLAQPGHGVRIDHADALPSRGAAVAAPRAASWAYQVVSLRNPTRMPLRIQFRWSDSVPWAAFDLAPGQGRYFWVTGGAAAPQVRFDADPSPASHPVQYALTCRTVHQSAVPGYGDAFHYAFALAGHDLVLRPSST